MQRLVNTFTVARLMALFIQRIVAGVAWQHEALVLEHFLDQLRLVAILFTIIVVVILPDIADVLEEQHGQDEIFVGVGADCAAEDIASRPERLVDVVLFYFATHGCSLISC
ncbi:hypothetical protein D3C76_1547330 [compost metagenome]